MLVILLKYLNGIMVFLLVKSYKTKEVIGITFLALFLSSLFMLGTIVFTYFIKKSVIKPEAQQLIMVDIVFPGLQLIISCYCLIRTLSGVKTKYSSSVFPIAYTIISVVFKFKKTNDVLHPSSDTPPGPLSNQSATIVKDTDKSNTPVDQIGNVDDTIVLKLDRLNNKGKKTTMENITLTSEMDPVAIVSKLRKLCYAEIVSVGPEKEPEKIEEEQVYKDL
ncbi:hypothetical protein ACOSQ3_004131 [Xanthoceras sorbifolium]